MRVKTISSQKTLSIRQLILRPGKSLEECVFKGDKNPANFHLGIFENEFLVGVVTLMNNKNPFFEENDQFQLRGMAVLPEFRNRKIGAELLKVAEEKLLARKTEILWCNARKTATGFYEKHGFERFGPLFEIPTIGLHYLMAKRLKK